MKRSTLIKDADNMENIAIKLGDRQDIWQDRFIYEIAIAIKHILDYIIKNIDKQMLKCPNCGLDVHSDFDKCPRCGEKIYE